MNTMEEQSVIHSTFVIERSYRATPERVFEAFADPSKKRSWFFQSRGHDLEHYELDFRVHGKESARFRFREGTPVAGLVCVNEGSYLDIVADRRLVLSSTMTIGDKCISASLATIELVPSELGTKLILTHQGAFFEGSDGPEMREAGWRTLLDRLNEELTR